MKVEYEFLVAYDIADNKSRKKVFDGLKDLGLFSFQRSIFIGKINKAEDRSIKRLLQQHTNKNCDKAFFLRGSFISQLQESGIGYSDFELNILDMVSYEL